MLVVFLITLSRWICPSNLSEVVDLANWNPSAHVFGPITYLVTYPLRWLPPAWMPLGLNLFSAVCAALSLCLLARSVALLPHDRTHEQRQREQSELSLLSIRTAWLPPLFAVLVCGLQMTFWQNATQGTSETFDLLLFAYVIRCLLEYRVGGTESWMVKFALVYGLGMANNWAMVGFFPLFLTAVIWIKGISFFNTRFLLRTAALGLAGFLLVFLLPLLNQISHTVPVDFWTMVRATFSGEKMIFTRFPRIVLGVLALTSLLPVLVMGIRWASHFGDNSPLGIFLATSIFHIVHALIFLACLWTMLDSPISPRENMHRLGLRLPFLTFYYLGALAVGYFSGYFLLVFGPRKSSRHRNPLPHAVNISVTCCVWLLAIAMPVVLLCKNLPVLKTNEAANKAFENYFTQIEQLLPSDKGAVVLCDDAFRLQYLHAVLSRHSQHPQHLLINTALLDSEPGYLKFLEKSNRGYQLSGPWTNIPPTAAPSLAKVQILDHLSASHDIYYMHPSFGYYFERFYAEPHGLVYKLKPYPTNVWNAPLPTKEQINENQAFWKKTSQEFLPPVKGLFEKPSTAAESGAWEKLLTRLHLLREDENPAAAVAVYYARALDEWGVQLQMAGLNVEAAKCFDEVLQLNPGSIAARVNKTFNQMLAAGKRLGIQSPKVIEKGLEQYRGGWTELLRLDGPIDEPGFRDELAAVLATGSNYRQAIQQLNRVRTLVPGDLRVNLQLAQLLLHIQTHKNGLSLLLPYSECYSMAMTNLDQVLEKYPKEPSALFMKSFVLMQQKSYDQAIEPLNRILAQPEQTSNYVAQLNRAIAHFKVGHYEAAKSDYEAVGKGVPNAYQVYYGLAEIADHQKDNHAAIKNYELYLTNAPPNTEEAKSVTARLKELKTGAH